LVGENLIVCKVYLFEIFGISKYFPVKLQELLIRAEMLDYPLTAQCLLLRLCVPCIACPDNRDACSAHLL